MNTILKYPPKKDWPGLLERPVFNYEALMDSVGIILKEVKENGDMALKKFSKQFDGQVPDSFEVSEQEIKIAEREVSTDLKNAILLAKDNIESFHSLQRFPFISSEPTNGVRVWQKSTAIEKVGLYIPGGSAPLISTLLMLGIPAVLAGCKEIVVCTPPNADGNIHPAILFTAQILGISKIFKVGGAQAIAAMAYGTESIPSVYKIFGPGNQYVTAAKLKVSLENIAIDLPAGPSELAVIADEDANPSFIASDLLSQAEHGEDSQVILVSESEKLIENVLSEIAGQLKNLPRKKVAEKALENSRFILLKSESEILELINLYAPEHLIIVTKNYKELSENIQNAGSVFLGEFSPESAGDYASGTNHTLPTNGNARAFSGVNLGSFMKKISFQEISSEGIKNIGRAVELMAEAENLQAHKNAVSLRLDYIKKQGL
ncbi:MAG: histidinol dehydrogenase [Bacteroidales bacterium]|nr:histidinol dehydrogenase [Bacteroidales bacterium]